MPRFRHRQYCSSARQTACSQRRQLFSMVSFRFIRSLVQSFEYKITYYFTLKPFILQDLLQEKIEEIIKNTDKKERKCRLDGSGIPKRTVF